MRTPAVSSGAVALLISLSSRGQAGGTEVILQLHMSPPVMFGNSSKGVIPEQEGVSLISSFWPYQHRSSGLCYITCELLKLLCLMIHA